ncbi:MAG TPA: rod shape-determining protein MreD [Clostridiales bacterium]|jgi:rod shape-determining protein MreD|nr:rod shape-determining protein MreD [Clostridiales bacterium]
MRYRAGITIAIAIIICKFIDNAIFAKYNLADIRPDMMLALLVVIGFSIGSMRAGLIGLGVGFLYDILYFDSIGINASVYMICGMAAGFFFRKFYADNVILPSIAAAVLCFIKHNILAIITALYGAHFNYFLMLIVYILPCALLTGVFCIPVYFVIKPLLKTYGKYIYDKQSSIV